MGENLNKSVIDKILNTLPENIKPVNYFMDILDIGKESAYRRLRGEKPLSLEEIHKLSSELDFSLDEIIGNKKTKSFAFNCIDLGEKNSENYFLEFLYYYEEFLKETVTSEHTEITCTMNHLINIMLIGYEELFKFIYYHWMHQMKEMPLNFHFAEMVIPADVKNVCNRISSLQKNIKKVTLIIDKNLHLNLIKEIQYFFVRGLLNESELFELKEQYLRFMDFSEKIVTKGVDDNDTVYEIYLSMLSINSTTSYAVWDNNNEVSAFWHNLCYPLHTRNKDIANRHKHWIESLKKYSTVITKSNELLQANFFNEQRAYINGIAEKILL